MQDHDEEMGPMRGMYGTMDAEVEVHRTIKRAEQRLSSASSGKLSVLWWCTLTRKESLMVCGRAKDADLWILMWEELLSPSRSHSGGGRARQSTPLKEGNVPMSLFEKFITEVNERADELAKEGAMLDGGAMAQVRASTVLQDREEVCAAP